MGEIMIKIVQGNILDAPEDVIAHQTNCMGVMGSGLAKQIREKYPKVFEEYQSYINKYKFVTLGSFQIINVGNNKYIANLFGQYGYGRNKQYTDYKALEEALFSLKVCCKENNKSVALPYNLGCGLAGGNWDIVYKIIEEVFSDYDVTIYKLD